MGGASVSVMGKTADQVHKQREKYPHFYNLNVDPMLTGSIVHILTPGKNKVRLILITFN